MDATVFPLPATGASYVQVTTTGEWEAATRLPSREAAAAYLADFDSLPSAIAVELLWQGPPVSFIGGRLDGDRVAELPDLVDVLTSPGVTAERGLGALSGGDIGPVTGADCGAINAWLSVGPANLWDGTTWREAAEVLASRPELLLCTYPVGLEVGHQNAWYAVEVSRLTGDGYAVDLALLNSLVDRLAALLGGIPRT